MQVAVRGGAWEPPLQAERKRRATYPALSHPPLLLQGRPPDGCLVVDLGTWPALKLWAGRRRFTVPQAVRAAQAAVAHRAAVAVAATPAAAPLCVVVELRNPIMLQFELSRPPGLAAAVAARIRFAPRVVALADAALAALQQLAPGPFLGLHLRCENDFITWSAEEWGPVTFEVRAGRWG